MRGRTKIEFQGIPVELGERSRRHWEGMRRELALMSYADGEAKGDLPDSAREFLERFRCDTDAMVLSSSEFAHAQRRGDARADIEVELPGEAVGGLLRLAELLDDIDDFARAGGMIATASPPECVALRRWMTDELERQARGERPTPWSGPLV